MQFDHIETGLTSPAGSLAECGDGGLNVGLCHLLHPAGGQYKYSAWRANSIRKWIFTDG